MTVDRATTSVISLTNWRREMGSAATKKDKEPRDDKGPSTTLKILAKHALKFKIGANIKDMTHEEYFGYLLDVAGPTDKEILDAYEIEARLKPKGKK